MAVGKGGKDNRRDDSSYLSDESDFYGDEAAKQELENRANSFSVREWWSQRSPTLMENAAANIEKAKGKKVATLYNIYEGRLDSRQLSETVDEFLLRLPPATSQSSESLRFIFIANPYREPPKKSELNQDDLTTETPLNENSDWAQFVVRGGELLQELTEIRHNFEKSNPSDSKATVTKAVAVQRDAIVKKLLETAVELHCTCGKWMIFCQADNVNAVWAVIARATVNNDLGTAAKVTPSDGEDRKPRLICIYTKDFSDMKDVSRVVHKLKDLGLVETKGKPIYYKCDAYTYLGLDSSNGYNIKASLYSSADFLNAKPEKAKDGNLDGFFHKKR